MSEKKNTRHFHAGKLRKTIGDTVYVSVAESCDTLYVARDGTFTSASRGWTPVRGNLEKDGYRRICIDGRHAVVARVVYEVFVESIPDGMEIDHINTVRDDNRVENLRVVTTLGGLGGIIYVTCGVSEWKFEYGVAGFGFLALAVMIFGQWKPTRIALAGLLFGLFRALSNVYSGIDILAALNLPSAIYNMMPYIISLLVLALTSKKSRAPKAEGIPYDKGSR